MPSREASGLSHVAITDHRVPRVADQFELPKGSAADHSDAILVNLHEHLLAADDPEARRDLGIALSSFEGDPRSDDAAQQAVAYLRAAVGRDEGDALACEALGRALARLGRYGPADAALRLATAASPNREPAWFYAADAAMGDGRAHAAVARFQEVNRINPRHADYRFLLGVAHFQTGAWPEALEQFDKTLEINPFHVGARLRSGDAHVELRQWRAASEQFELVLRMIPKDLGARIGMAKIAFRQAEYRAAVPWLQQILADQPDQTDARRLLIECYNRLGEKQRAAEEAQRLTPAPDGP
jgi:tetratricopeptide (TPR) repeat protein